MLSSTLAHELNKQINVSFDAAHAYHALAAYCNYYRYPGFTAFYVRQSETKRQHAMKVLDYLNARGLQAHLCAVAAPKTDFKSLLATFETALQLEKSVTNHIYKLIDAALSEKEHATLSFLNWFLDEQVQAEAAFETHLNYLRRFKDDKNALFTYEEKLSAHEDEKSR